MAVWLLAIVLLLFTGGEAQNSTVSVVLSPTTGQLTVVQGKKPGAVAWAQLTDNIQETGWAVLKLQTDAKYNDSIQAYAAGVAEAAVSQRLIYMHWMNTLMGYCGPYKYQTAYCEKLQNYLQANLDWMQQEMETGGDYWHQIRLALLQLKGLEDSYNGRITFPLDKFTINPFGFLLFQLGGDLEDLESALNKSESSTQKGTGSCSALIKLLPGNKDLFVSHDTWNTYQSMLRIIKKYTLPFRISQNGGTVIPGSVQTFSSYPGTIFSGDDFYLLSSGLVTLETTIGNSNPVLWKYINPQGSVMEWLRNIVANRLATGGKEWANIFSKFNSGTYNNQWMIVDYNKFHAGQTEVTAGLLTVLEQIPGMVVTDDKSEELYRRGYWASYNLPYFETVFNASGVPALVDKYGDWFDYHKNPRAQIFQRDHMQVKDLASMIHLMRYNDYLHDPLSYCSSCEPKQNAENAISARSDLNAANGTYPFGALRQRQHGGTDMKVTTYDMAKLFQMVAVNGPTWDQVPPFQWSTSPYSNLMHMGHPDIWKFSPVTIHWD
ncbi:LOW QUALITY PROTEIN: putative phospholipase B-like 2 [Bombina bombina]|uniref:LOW QUALITY PROTEIN: putative phospholipase B-like 2 n=1 Tax=Bombina bombina TaxID=8345 RepID=UPI00235A7F0E|nr:LOW QUALITY PROTEIN: putative phospholipase B-like 2 [Bombina bombina]